MKRDLQDNIRAWIEQKDRRPLLLKGARQVGKSYLIAKGIAPFFEDFCEINFEFQAQYKNCFGGDLTPSIILENIALLRKKTVTPGKTLLFLDEVQLCPQAITALRYFYEKMPELHVVAAGSLVEFTLEQIGVPVGRVTSMYLHPLSFGEFLNNAGEQKLIETILNHNIKAALPETYHQRALQLFKQYLVLGGMPKVLSTYIESQNLPGCEQVLNDILIAYRDDFPRYAKRNKQLEHVSLAFEKAPFLATKQFKFVHFSREVQAKDLRIALEALSKAGVINLVCKAHAVPLGATFDPDRFKLLFLDVGLMQRACGLPIASWLNTEFNLANSGALAEQFIGQEILSNSGPHRQRLYYWERDKAGSTAELDYIVEIDGKVIPIEVKSAAAGHLKSLHVFLNANKDVECGLKLSLENFGRVDRIQSIPLYAFGLWLKNQLCSVENLRGIALKE